MNYLPIARRLLADEQERLLNNHFDDVDLTLSACEGCNQATRIRLEIKSIDEHVFRAAVK